MLVSAGKGTEAAEGEEKRQEMRRGNREKRRETETHIVGLFVATSLIYMAFDSLPLKISHKNAVDIFIAFYIGVLFLNA